MPWARTTIIVGIFLAVATRAGAQTAPSRADEILAPAPPPTGAASVATGQVATPAGSSDVSASQIVAAPGDAASAAQLTRSRPTADAPAQLTHPSQGRDTHIAAVHGRDRCDPTAGASARQPECARIPDNRVDDFANRTPDPSAPVVNADAPPASMVNDILNGGTGTVVALPGK